ncbi:MAG TPA: SH3 domain-containing protein [Alphaproteobacteria bacterium]|nr:SH3 domain-containing protein [Alphaproteobacteria bacterium]
MAKRVLPAVMMLAALATLLGGRPAAACGSVELLTRMYLYGNPMSKARALEWLAGGKCGKPDIVMLTYRGAASDKQLLSVLRDVVAKGKRVRLAARIFYTYRCLPAAEFERGYARLRKALAATAGRGQRCPRPTARRQWLTVLRAETLHRLPNDRTPATGLVRKGNVVTALGRAGGWARVRSWRGEAGWMPRDALARYGAR